MKKRTLFLILIIILLFSVSGCHTEGNYLSLNAQDRGRFNRLYRQLEAETSYQKRFIVMRQILEFLSGKVSNGEINLFLTTYAEKNQDDPFNAYYLMVVARKFREDMAFPFAVKYYERILRNYHDLLYRGNSIHFLALRDLLDIVDDDEARILYYRDKITRFSDNINVSEIYYHLGNSYARMGEWDRAIQAYRNFLNTYDSSISVDSDARERVVEFLAYYNANVNWTFESLDELVDKVVSNINVAKFRSDGRLLRSNMSRVNFFAISWEDRERTADPEFIANLGVFLSPRISVSRSLDGASNQHEAFLRTTGWSHRIPTWYLYFRRVNFPADSEIHRNWEWAGIYLGEKPFAVSDER
ncbi:MAG: tetratricopeptide repeat protein [Spirochaetaceae bacterium]|nr:tetratricopeptide repeat protein [Spirochaetaceae bacterium]